MPNQSGRIIPQVSSGGAGRVVHEHHYHGPVVQDSNFVHYLRELDRKYALANGGRGIL